MRFRTAALASIAVVCAVPAVPSSATLPRCPSSGETLARSSQARVWKGSTGFTYGCTFRTGRVFKLDPKGGEVDGPASKLALAGTAVAYETAYADPAPYRVIVRSLRTGKVLHSVKANGGSEMGHGGPVWEMRVNRRGFAAWSASVDCACEEVNYDDKGWSINAVGSGPAHLVLDIGPAVAPRTIALHGSTVSWQHGSEQRSATLH